MRRLTQFDIFFAGCIFFLQYLSRLYAATAPRFLEFTLQNSKDLDDVYGEVFDDHCNEKGAKAQMGELKTTIDSHGECLALKRRVDKLESNYIRKLLLWLSSSGTIGTGIGSIIGGLAVWWFTR